ncbi:DsrE family protein [Congregibacter sp.]|uniref:DsrE family protein n=1 Tax=Congregibacter sp. TaxID=2744308 RepID=UPI003F6B45C7
MSDSDRKPLILFQSSPYEGSLGRSAIDLALAFAVFAQDPVVVFSGDAVLSLKDGQNADAVGRKSLRKVIDSLPLYDLDTVYVDQTSLRDHGVDSSGLPDFAVSLSAPELRQLIQEASHVISL